MRSKTIDIPIPMAKVIDTKYFLKAQIMKSKLPNQARPNQPKSQFLFHKNCSLLDLCKMTLPKNATKHPVA